MDTPVDLAIDDLFAEDRAGDDVIVTEALRELRRTALRCRRARLLLDVEPDVVVLTARQVAG